MAGSTTRLNYDELNLIARQLHAESEAVAHLYSSTRQKVRALSGDWNGRAAEAFFNEMGNSLLPATQRVAAALSTSQDVLNQIIKTIHDADMDTVAFFKDIDAAIAGASQKSQIVAGTSSGFAFPKWAETAIKWTKIAGNVAQSSLIVAAIKNGNTYTDQIKIFGSDNYLKYFLGLNPSIRNIAGASLIDDMVANSSKITPLGTAFALFKVGVDVIPDWLKYPDVSHRAASISTNSFIAAASVSGMAAGAAIGSVFPGVGTVVGGLAGGVIGELASDHVFSTPLSKLIPQLGMVAGGAAGSMMLPGFGSSIGWDLGGNGGKMITGLISPEISKLTLKELIFEGTTGLINSSGEFLGNQIYQAIP